MDYFEIGQRIRKYRKACGMSQEALAAEVDISVTHMSHIETGNTKLSLPVLVTIAEVLAIQTDDLIFGEKRMTKTDYTDDLARLLEDCSAKEARIIVDAAKDLKITLKKYL